MKEKLQKIYEELDAIREKEDQNTPSFLFSFDAGDGYTTIGRSSAVHDISLIFSVIEKVKADNPLAYGLLLFKLAEHVMNLRQNEEQALPKAAPEGVVLQ